MNCSNPELSSIYSKMLEKALQSSMLHLRVIDRNYAENLKNQIKVTEEQNQFGYLFIFIMIIYILNCMARIFLPLHLNQLHSLPLISFALSLFLPTLWLITYYMHSSVTEFVAVKPLPFFCRPNILKRLY